MGYTTTKRIRYLLKNKKRTEAASSAGASSSFVLSTTQLAQHNTICGEYLLDKELGLAQASKIKRAFFQYFISEGKESGFDAHTMESNLTTGNNKFKPVTHPASLSTYTSKLVVGDNRQPCPALNLCVDQRRKRSVALPVDDKGFGIESRAFIVDGVLTPAECNAYIEAAEAAGMESLEGIFPKDYRSNYRVVTIAPDNVVRALFERLVPYMNPAGMFAQLALESLRLSDPNYM